MSLLCGSNPPSSPNQTVNMNLTRCIVRRLARLQQKKRQEKEKEKEYKFIQLSKEKGRLQRTQTQVSIAYFSCMVTSHPLRCARGGGGMGIGVGVGGESYS